MASPSERSRKKWRDLGYRVFTTEHFQQLPGGLPIRRDLFGFVDMVAVPEEGPWIFIQTTSWTNVRARLKKILTEEHGTGQWKVPMAWTAARILERDDRLLVEGWKKDKGRYVSKELWIDQGVLLER